MLVKVGLGIHGLKKLLAPIALSLCPSWLVVLLWVRGCDPPPLHTITLHYKRDFGNGVSITLVLSRPQSQPNGVSFFLPWFFFPLLIIISRSCWC